MPNSPRRRAHSPQRRCQHTYRCTYRAWHIRAFVRPALNSIGLGATCLVLGCFGQPDPTPPPPTGGLDGTPTYADVVVAYTNAAGVQSCTGAPGCPPVGECTSHESLGAPDEVPFVLDSDGRLEVAFFCSAVLDQSGVNPTADLRIWADVPAGAQAVVAASQSGGSYQVVDYLTESDQSFDLMRTELPTARFVLITHDRGPAISIDAIEALR